MRHDPGALGPLLDDMLDDADQVVARIWARDPTLWHDPRPQDPDPLGWLDAVDRARAQASTWAAVADDLVADGITDVVLVGMGATTTYGRVLGNLVEAPQLRLHVLDSTHPDAVQRVRDDLDPATWAVLVSSRSGTTIETTSLAARLGADLAAAVGADDAARHCLALTTAGSPLDVLARDAGFRAVVEADADVGGRFAALSAFGLLPAALLGIDVVTHVEAAATMAVAARVADARANDAAGLGAFLAAAMRAGRNQVTVVLEPHMAPFGAWVEQLVAATTGKDGTGLLPVVDEPMREPVAYGPGRVVVAVGEHFGVRAVADAGTPVLVLPAVDLDTLAGEVLRWEFAAAVATGLLGIDLFAQPDVVAARATARRVLEGGGMRLQPQSADDLVDELDDAEFLCLLAWVDPQGATARRLDEAVPVLRRRFGIPVTVGLGPRYLHTTGQLHKGGPPGGVYAVVVEAGTARVDIPGSVHDFSDLMAGQVAGDVRALRDAGRTVGVVTVDDLLDA